MPLDEERKNANVAFQAIFWAWKECRSQYENILSDIHNYDLPIEAVIVQANVEDAIKLKCLVLSEFSSAFPYFEKDN